MMRQILAATLLVLSISSSARAASFSCKAAKTPREKTVCANPDLSSQDDQINRAYAATRAQLTPASAALVQADQREWLLWIDKVCPANNPATDIKPCLTDNYTSRLDQLTKGVRRLNGTLFYTRAHFVFKPGKAPGKDDPHNDPGFGYGEFAWPQVDAPDPDHALFNTAVYRAALDVEAVSFETKAATFDGAVDTSGYVDGFFTLTAVNEHFIEVDLGNSAYGWGAAHPLTEISSFIWSLDLRRALTPADVLRPESNWKTALVDPAIAKVHERLGPDGSWKGQELRKAVAAGIADPTSWTLSSQGLSVTFGQYAVASYAQGTPSITFTWGELAPYLNPSFDPRLLPPVDPAQR